MFSHTILYSLAFLVFSFISFSGFLIFLPFLSSFRAILSHFISPPVPISLLFLNCYVFFLHFSLCFFPSLSLSALVSFFLRCSLYFFLVFVSSHSFPFSPISLFLLHSISFHITFCISLFLHFTFFYPPPPFLSFCFFYSTFLPPN